MCDQRAGSSLWHINRSQVNMQAMNVLQQMVRTSSGSQAAVEPDEITFRSAISACCKASPPRCDEPTPNNQLCIDA
jgi:hypothetical protein